MFGSEAVHTSCFLLLISPAPDSQAAEPTAFPPGRPVSRAHGIYSPEKQPVSRSDSREVEQNTYGCGEGDEGDRVDLREQLLPEKDHDAKHNGLPQKQVSKLM